MGLTRAFAEAGNGVSQLTVALVAVLDVLPQLLLGQGVALAGHMTRLCCGFLQHQAATVVPNAAHHIQTPRSTRHYHLILGTSFYMDTYMSGSPGMTGSSVYEGEGWCYKHLPPMPPILPVQ